VTFEARHVAEAFATIVAWLPGRHWTALFSKHLQTLDGGRHAPTQTSRVTAPRTTTTTCSQHSIRDYIDKATSRYRSLATHLYDIVGPSVPTILPQTNLATQQQSRPAGEPSTAAVCSFPLCPPRHCRAIAETILAPLSKVRQLLILAPPDLPRSHLPSCSVSGSHDIAIQIATIIDVDFMPRYNSYTISSALGASITFTYSIQNITPSVL